MSEPLPSPLLASLAGIVADGPPPLFATVSGAHLYGFASPDSDVDLRGSFVLPTRALLGVRRPAVTLTRMVERSGVELDWVAHDVAKFAVLLTRDNGYALEQLYSPLVVHGGAWHEELRALARGFVTRGLLRHYRGFAATVDQHLAGEGATAKDLLCAYRVRLTGIHVLRTGEVLSHLPSLLEAVEGLPDGTRDEVARLLARKRHGSEREALDAAERVEHAPRLAELMDGMVAAHDGSVLPRAGRGHEALDDFVVRTRLALGGMRPTVRRTEL